MQHVAIGLGGRKSPICVRAEDGRILHEGKIATLGLEGYLKRQPPSRVVLETCAEAFGIADQVLNLEHEVRVVPGTLPSPGSDRLRACVSSPLSMTSPGSTMHMPSRAFLGCPIAVCANAGGCRFRSIARRLKLRAKSPIELASRPTHSSELSGRAESWQRLSRGGERVLSGTDGSPKHRSNAVAPIASRQRTSTYAPLSADTRLRQPVDAFLLHSRKSGATN